MSAATQAPGAMNGQRLVLVAWEDSHALTRDGWMHLDGAYSTEPRVVYSVGWLHVDTARVKIIVPHTNRAAEGSVAQGAGVISIPTRCVVRMVDLREVTGKRRTRRQRRKVPE